MALLLCDCCLEPTGEPHTRVDRTPPLQLQWDWPEGTSVFIIDQGQQVHQLKPLTHAYYHNLARERHPPPYLPPCACGARARITYPAAAHPTRQTTTPTNDQGVRPGPWVTGDTPASPPTSLPPIFSHLSMLPALSRPASSVTARMMPQCFMPARCLVRAEAAVPLLPTVLSRRYVARKRAPLHHSSFTVLFQQFSPVAHSSPAAPDPR